VHVVLIPGAGGRGWIWHLAEADLRRRGYPADFDLDTYFCTTCPTASGG
jgi:hypothetical protein